MTDKIINPSIRKLPRFALKQGHMQAALRRICTTASTRHLVNANEFFFNSNEDSYLRDLVWSRCETEVELCAHLPHNPWKPARRNEIHLQNDAHGRHDCRRSVLHCPATLEFLIKWGSKQAVCASSAQSLKPRAQKQTQHATWCSRASWLSRLGVTLPPLRWTFSYNQIASRLPGRAVRASATQFLKLRVQKQTQHVKS